jgi:hypothetical protein
MSDKRIVARWETKGKDWLELYQYRSGNLSVWFYSGNGCGGGLNAADDKDAIERMEAPRGDPRGWGQASVLKADRPSLRRVR